MQIVLSAYNDLDSRTKIVSEAALSKPQRVEDFIKQHVGTVTKAKILESLPDISQSTVQSALYNLLKQNKIKKVTSGRYASYV